MSTIITEENAVQGTKLRKSVATTVMSEQQLTLHILTEVRERADQVFDLRDRIESKANGLFGCEPEEKEHKEEPAQSEYFSGQIKSELQRLRRNIEDLSNQFARFDEL